MSRPTAVPAQVVLNGTKYIQHPLKYPDERKCRHSFVIYHVFTCILHMRAFARLIANVFSAVISPIPAPYPTPIRANIDASHVPSPRSLWAYRYHTRMYARICMISLLTCAGTRNRYWITLGREVFGQGTVSELASPVLPRLSLPHSPPPVPQ